MIFPKHFFTGENIIWAASFISYNRNTVSGGTSAQNLRSSVKKCFGTMITTVFTFVFSYARARMINYV